MKFLEAIFFIQNYHSSVQISVCKFLGMVFGITYHQIICHEYNEFANTSTIVCCQVHTFQDILFYMNLNYLMRIYINCLKKYLENCNQQFVFIF